jgi:hypothetical protein
MIPIKVLLMFFVFVVSFVRVNCSADELNKLRSEWREKLVENQVIMNETRKLKEQLDIESSFYSKVSNIQRHVGDLKKLNAIILDKECNSFKDIFDKKMRALDDLKGIKTKAEETLENAKNLLLRKEIEFEGLWRDNDYFIKSIDFILKNSLMTPVPKFPQISGEKAEDIKNMFEKGALLIGLEGQLLERRRNILKAANEKIYEIENEFKRFNFMEKLSDNFEILKARIMSSKLKDEKVKSRLLNLIFMYQKNQEEEINLIERKTLNESTGKLRQNVDFLLSSDQWKLRTGHVEIVAAAFTVSSPAKNPGSGPAMIDEKITRVSRLASNAKTLESLFIHLTKYNDTEKMKYVALIGENKIYKFMVKKCAKIVEGMHRYLVKGDDKEVPIKGIYAEVLEDLAR